MTPTQENQFKLTILSHTKTLLDQHVVFAIIPGEEGEFGVLAQHAPLVAILQAGQVKVYREDKQTVTEVIHISGGFASIKNNTCEVLLNE